MTYKYWWSFQNLGKTLGLTDLTYGYAPDRGIAAKGGKSSLGTSFLLEDNNPRPSSIHPSFHIIYVYIRTVSSLSLFSLVTFDSYLAGPGRNILCIVWCMSKWPINQFIPVHQSRQQALRPYCPNIYSVYHS